MKLYQYDFYTTDIDDCVSVTCHNGGSCVDNKDGYKCTCTAGYTGEHCEGE